MKLLERLIYNRVCDGIGKLTPPGRAGFRKDRSSADQVLALTNHIENGYQRNLKTGAVFIDLTAAYDTVPCLQICDLLNNMLSDRLFQVFLNDQRSRFMTLNNGLPQGSVLSSLLFNLYTHDLPPSESRKFLYADDMAHTTQHEDFNRLEKSLTNDMVAFNITKTVVSCFHLNNQAANSHVRWQHSRARVCPKISWCECPLTFKQHTTQLAAKLSTRNNLLQKLAGTSWGATATSLKISALGLVFSTAEYCCPAWLNRKLTSN